MNSRRPSRRQFLKTTALSGVGAFVAGPLGAISGAGGPKDGIAASPATGVGAPPRPRASDQKPVHDLVTRPTERLRVGVVGLSRGMMHVESCLNIEFAEVVAVCDLREDRALDAANRCEQRRGRRPAVYAGTEEIWEQLVEREDLDIVYIATPWAWHLPMALRAMERGKHAFVEVMAVLTVADGWQLVDTSERTQRHCVMLENCCYGENELFVLNLARTGVLGELTHAECAYIHDLRGVLFTLGTEGDWRRDYHWRYNGNLYPTHGLGPAAQSLGVGRGDQFKFLVSMSSPEAGLTRYREQHRPNGGRHAGEKYLCGDVNTSLIKTESGRTIMLQHDVVSPRPYSRINGLTGTGGTFFDFPARLALNDPKAYGLGAENSEEWLNEKDMTAMRARFTHPLWRKLAERAKGAGHGGMDFVMNWRHLDCIRQGLTPDSVVYDAAAWSCIVELSSQSVAAGSTPVPMPDFTRGLWRTLTPLGVAESVSVST